MTNHDAAQTAAWEVQTKYDLKQFRKCPDPTDYDNFKSAIGPLEWRAIHASLFPIFARIARMVFVVPASQTLCERIYFLPGR
jgi:hypothetical protein